MPELYVAVKLHGVVKRCLCADILPNFSVFLEVNRTVARIDSSLYGVKSPFYIGAETAHKHRGQIALQYAVRRPSR